MVELKGTDSTISVVDSFDSDGNPIYRDKAEANDWSFGDGYSRDAHKAEIVALIAAIDSAGDDPLGIEADHCAALEAIKGIEHLAERWEETVEWHEPPFLHGRVEVTTGDLRCIATLVRHMQAES